jgi:hypothetical protein
MANLQDMNRVLYRHDWRSVEEWASAIDHLADLSEQEIGDMVGKASPSRNGGQQLPFPDGLSERQP